MRRSLDWWEPSFFGILPPPAFISLSSPVICLRMLCRRISRMAPKKGPRARWLSSSAAPRAVEPPPSREQLRALFLHSLVPMVGFGIMDQTVMVTAGDLIDNTIGVRFGLATLTAAACGQVVSDVCGVCFGGTVEAIATRMGLKHSSMTMVQRGMKISKVVSLAGAVLGVITGCVLGMGTLLLIDTTSKEREKRQQEMDTIFRAIMVDGHEVIGAEAISLFFLDRDKQELWSKLATDQEGEFVQTPKLITIPVDKGIAGDCVRSKEPVNVVDCYKDPRHWDNVDKSMKTKTHNLLAVPVLDREDGSCIGVIEFMNKKNPEDGTPVPFDDQDIRLSQLLSSHVAVFISQLEGGKACLQSS